MSISDNKMPLSQGSLHAVCNPGRSQRHRNRSITGNWNINKHIDE